MGLFDGLIGGLVGAEMATVVNGLIQKHGGIEGIVFSRWTPLTGAAAGLRRGNAEPFELQPAVRGTTSLPALKNRFLPALRVAPVSGSGAGTFRTCR
jgi:hypothetical protein